MLGANVGLGGKMSEDYDSTGFSPIPDAGINAPLDDGEAVVERTRGLYRHGRGSPEPSDQRGQANDAFAARHADDSDHPSAKSHANGRRDSPRSRRASGGTAGTASLATTHRLPTSKSSPSRPSTSTGPVPSSRRHPGNSS